MGLYAYMAQLFVLQELGIETDYKILVYIFLFQSEMQDTDM